MVKKDFKLETNYAEKICDVIKRCNPHVKYNTTSSAIKDALNIFIEIFDNSEPQIILKKIREMRVVNIDSKH